MRCACLGRASLLAIVLLVLALSAMRGVAGSWSATPLAVVNWAALAGSLGDGTAALVSGVGRALADLLGATWQALAAIPWRTGIDAVVAFIAALGAGFAALVRDLGRSLVDATAEVWHGSVAQFRSLIESPSGETLDPKRLVVVAGGWLVVLAVLAWFAARMFGGWIRSAWGRLFRRGYAPSRPRSPARV